MEKRIEELIQRINDLNYHYYTLDEPKLSDKEYDLFYDELLELEEKSGIIHPYSPTQRVGGEIIKGFEKHNHLASLWSLAKSQNAEELISWDNRVRGSIDDFNESNDDKLPQPTYILEYKFDGLTINLTYENGHLVQGATRGNGAIGEGILAQLRTIRSIPLTVDFKGTMEIQGEGLMPLSALEEYNKTALEPLKNARNAAAGALRNLDTKVTSERNLIGYFYNIGYIEGKTFEDHMEVLDFLKVNKLPVFPYAKKFTKIEEIIKEIDIIKDERMALDVLTDGLVI